MKIKANICISRDSSDMMRLKVQDEASRATFLEIEMTPHDLMMCLTGLGHVDTKSAEVRDLSVVGKVKIAEKRTIVYPGSSFDSRADKENWLSENGAPEGWIVNPYLGSQGSIGRNGDETLLHYTIHRYVSADELESN